MTLTPEDLVALSNDDLKRMWVRLRDKGDFAGLEALTRAVELRSRADVDRFFPEAREKQLPPPGEWLIWLILAGRGFGKTRTGAEYLVDLMLRQVAPYAILAETFTKGRDICIEGREADQRPVGMLSVLERRGYRRGRDFTWNRSTGELVLANLSSAKLLSAEKEGDSRGWNFAGAWVDEYAQFHWPGSFDQLRFALRVGSDPRMVVTTTPQPIATIRALAVDGSAVVTRGTTYENRDNLNAQALAALEAKYAGTMLGRQELEGEILDDAGTYFVPSWFREVARCMFLSPRRVRSWDLAGSLPTIGASDPDWTVGLLIAYEPPEHPYVLLDGTEIWAGRFCIEEMVRMRETPAIVEQAVLDCARRDGPEVGVVIEREGGQSGKSQIAHLQQMLAGTALVTEFAPSGPKAVRAQLTSTAAQQGRVELVRAHWNGVFLDEHAAFTGTKTDQHDDIVDSFSQGAAVLEGRGGPAGVSVPLGQLPSRAAMLSRGR